MKNTLKGTNSRLANREQISDPEDRLVEINQSEQQKENRILKNNDRLRDL